MKLLVTGLIMAASIGNAVAQNDTEPDESNRLSHSADIVDRLVVMDTEDAWKAGESQLIEPVTIDGKSWLQLANDRERGFPRRGRFITPEIETDYPFQELLPSWNVVTPDNTGAAFQVRVRMEGAEDWSPWLYIGYWGRTPKRPDRTLDFEQGEVNVDYLILKQPATHFQMRMDMYDFNLEPKEQPRLRRLSVSYSGHVTDEAEREKLRTPVRIDGNWARSLPVPFFTQTELDKSVSGSTCSPTSVSMLMFMRGIHREVIQNALEIYDDEYGIFGVWNRATSLPGTYGLPTWLSRFRNWDQVKEQIAAGQPIIASIRFKEGEFPSNPMKSTRGHLIVIRGMTPEGDIIVNDPAHRYVGESIVYKADELAAAWFGKGGVGYIIGEKE